MITEGGNVFKDPTTKEPLTRRIKQSEVPGTIAWIEKLTGLDFSSVKDPDTQYPIKWLGSTGKTETSGDLDLAVDVKDISKPALAAKLTAWVKAQKQDPVTWVQSKGEVHLRTPINGDPTQGFVQTDFMFFPDVDWGVFYYGGGINSAYKGMFRNILLSSLAKFRGLTVGANGVKNRSTNQVISTDPDQLAQWLLGPGHTQRDLKNVETIYQQLTNDPDREAKLSDFKGYLAQANMSEPDTVVRENDVHFLARLRDRIVKQGMYALIEAEQPRTKKDPRIPHPEDAVFLGGSAKAQEQLDALDQAVQNAMNITIKWDGKPAIIFGYLPDGSFTVVDKYMWDAGFAARSPEDWVKYDQQKATGNLRPDLYPKIRAIWPGLQAAVKAPGFYWGDLLWAGQLQPVNGQYTFTPNTVQYTVDANSALGKTIPNTSGGVVVHQTFDKFGQPQAKVWNGQGLETVPGGVDIIRPNLGITFQLKPATKLSQTARSAIQKYGAAVDQMLSMLPASARAQLQTYFNQRVIGRTNLSLPNWLKTKASGATLKTLLGYTMQDQQGQSQYVPGALFTVDRTQQVKPSAAYQGLEKIWSSIYNYKLNLAQQLEAQIQGIEQRTRDAPEGEGFIVPTAKGLVKLVNRGVFSASNVAKNNPVA